MAEVTHDEAHGAERLLQLLANAANFGNDDDASVVSLNAHGTVLFGNAAVAADHDLADEAALVDAISSSDPADARTVGPSLSYG